MSVVLDHKKRCGANWGVFSNNAKGSGFIYRKDPGQRGREDRFHDVAETLATKHSEFAGNLIKTRRQKKPPLFQVGARNARDGEISKTSTIFR